MKRTSKPKFQPLALIATIAIFATPLLPSCAIGQGQPTLAPVPALNYHIVSSQYPSSDTIVAAYTDRDANLDKTGKTDHSAAIQQALNTVGAAGGGTLFLSAGIYRLDSPLTVPQCVTLRGEIGQSPSDPLRYQGTILAAYAGRNQADAPSLIALSESSGIRDCIVWYPEQNPDSIVPYPPAVNHNSGSTNCENVVFVNAYQAYRSGYHMSGRAYVRDIRGTALGVGVEIDGLADTGRVEGVHLSPDYWAHSGLPGSPAPGDDSYRQYMLANGVGIEERRIDWTNTADIDIDGYNKGYYTTYSLNTEDLNKGHTKVAPNGENYDYKIRNCVYGVYLDATANSGLIFTHFDIQATKAGFYLGADCANIATLLDVKIDCPGNAFENHGTGRVLMRDCHFEDGAFDAENGVIDCVAGAFAPAACRIDAGTGLVNASFFGDTFAQQPVITGDDTAKAAVHIAAQAEAPQIDDNSTLVDFRTPRKPAREVLYVVTDPKFGAVGDQTTDCTHAFQSALAAAGQAGGGIVFVPAGAYLVSAPLTVPSGVELRGVFDGPHDADTMGSCILVATGQGSADGPPFLTLKAGSLLRGLNFHYPGQDIANIVDFPFLIRGEGAGITIADIASANVSRFIDLMSRRCDDAFVDHLEGQPIYTGLRVGGGSENVTVTDCQFNPSNWTFATIFNAPKVEFKNDPTKRGPAVNAYTHLMQEHGEQYVLGDCTNLRFYRNFVFAGRYGLRCMAENGRGPSGTCLELGVDGSATALRIESLGAAGFPFINSQLVVTSTVPDCGYDIDIAAGFSGVARFYGINAWGPHTLSSVRLASGTARIDGAHLRDPGDPALDIENGKVVLSASCIRHDANVLPTPLQSASTVLCAGNILPDTATGLAALNGQDNLIYTDDAAKKTASK